MAWTRPSVIPAWANSGDKVAPTNAEVEVGWPVTTIPPSRQRFNWFFNVVHAGVLYLTRRGLADWSAAETYEVGDRCNAANGKSYRCTVANTNVEPSANPAKWERWGWTESELNAWFLQYLPYGAPVACANTGPDGAANKQKIHKSGLGEYWMWLGDSWKLVSSGYRLVAAVPSNALSAGVTTAIANVTAPRNGMAVLRGIVSAKNASGLHTELMGQIRRVRSGVTTLVDDSVSVGLTTIADQYAQARPYSVQDVQAGDVFYLLGTASQAVNASPANASSIYLEYFQ